jgi:probable DNA repair protein
MTPDHWVSALYESSLPDKVVLRPAHLQALAERVVSQSKVQPPDMLSSQAVARRFVEAFTIYHLYALDPDACPANSADGDAFTVWRQELETALDEIGALSSAQLPSVVAAQVASQEVITEQDLTLCPELDLPPSIRHILDVLEEQGRETAVLDLPEWPPGKRYQWREAGSSIYDEATAAAAWVADQLRQNGGAGTYAIATPALREHEEPLRRALEQHVYPFSLLPELSNGQIEEPWRIGTGKLAGYPVIAAAADLLGLVGYEIELEHLSRALRSPFISGANSAETRRARHITDLALREHESRSLTKTRLQALTHSREGFEPITALLQCADAASGRRLPSGWITQFTRELAAAGWPGRDTHDPVIAQCIEGLNEVFDAVRAMDGVLGAVDRGTVHRWLTTILGSKRFELNRDAAPTIQILTIEEADGARYDGLWLTGMSDSVLPRPAEQSPFLSVQACVEAGVPRANAQDSLHRDRELVNRLMTQADVVVTSCADVDPTGVPQGPTPIIPWDAEPAENAKEPAFAVEVELETPSQERVRAVTKAEASTLRGGTGIFKAIGLSPFTAFLTVRLGLKPFPEPTEGVDPAQQGEWTHRALEVFWQQYRDQATLQAMPQSQLDSAIADAVDTALSGAAGVGPTLLSLERRRLQTLLAEWLTLEASRPDPFTVIATEAAHQLDINGLPIKVKIDRVDRIDTPDKPSVVMDYKTGSIQANHLDATTLKEPQLPIYAAYGQLCEGLALATVRQGDCRIHTRSRWAHDLLGQRKPGKNDVATPEAWANSIAAWRTRIDEMAAQLMSGDIRHDYAAKVSDFKYHPYVLTLSRDDG